MKKILTLLLPLLLICCFISAQQGVAINTDGSAPHVSAMLDVKSINKGFLAPRMTAAERIAIATPAAGLMVYETTSNSHWVYNGTSWIQLGSGLQWTTNASNIYNSNSGNVGIGTSTPASKFHLQGNMLISNSNPIIQFQQAGTDKGFIQLAGNNLRLGTNSDNGTGKIVFRASGNDHIFIDSIGQLGIGKSTPQFDLDVNGNARIQSLSAYKRSTLSLYANPNYNSDPFGPAGITFFNWQSLGNNDYDYNAKFRVEMDGGSAERLKLYHVDHDNQLVLSKTGEVGIGKTFPTEKLNVLGNVQLEAANPLLKIKSTAQILPTAGIEINTVGGTAAKILYTENALKISEGSGANQLVIKDSKIGIGTDSPEERLHVLGNMKLNYFNPIIQFQNTGIDKGFVQLSGDNLRIGTNSSNDLGSFVVRTNGADRFLVDALGVAAFNNNVVMSANAFISGDARVSGALNIGTSLNTSGYIVRIGGKMICEEVRVKLRSSGWPDYVFSDKYKLPTLQELESFIQINKHLPNIPSAAEVEKDGIALGDMQKRMMEKIEELTLYILQLEKKNQALSIRITSLENNNK